MVVQILTINSKKELEKVKKALSLYKAKNVIVDKNKISFISNYVFKISDVKTVKETTEQLKQDGLHIWENWKMDGNRLLYVCDKKVKRIKRKTKIKRKTRKKKTWKKITGQNKQLLLLGCPNALHMAKNVAENLGADYEEPKKTVFGDGELKFSIDAEIEGRDIVIIQSGKPPKDKPVDPAGSVFDVCLVADVARKAKARGITCVMTYLPFGRQDKRKFPKGDVIEETSTKESLTLKQVLRHLKISGVQKLITFDAHFSKGPGEKKRHGMNIVNIAVGEMLIDHVKNRFRGKGDVVLVAPDAGSAPRVEILAKKTGLRMVECEKIRDNQNDVAVTIKDGKELVKNNNMLMVDDMIATGGTLVTTKAALDKENAGQVIAAATHGAFWGKGLARMREMDYCVVTDSVDTEFSRVFLTQRLVKFLKKYKYPIRKIGFFKRIKKGLKGIKKK